MSSSKSSAFFALCLLTTLFLALTLMPQQAEAQWGYGGGWRRRGMWGNPYGGYGNMGYGYGGYPYGGYGSYGGYGMGGFPFCLGAKRKTLQKMNEKSGQYGKSIKPLIN